MITIRRAGERLHTSIGWLDSFHSFSFAEHYDPRFMGFRALRVLNEDRIAPGRGFGTHAHRDMEVLTYVIAGALHHQDSLGTGAIVHAGEVQRMTAGTGVLHSETNASDAQPVHLIQVWILPEKPRLQPGYEQRPFPPASRRGRLALVASNDGRDRSVTIHQDAAVYLAALASGERATHRLRAGRHAWAHVVRGRIELNGTALSAGDGAGLTDEPHVELVGSEDSETLVLDLA